MLVQERGGTRLLEWDQHPKARLKVAAWAATKNAELEASDEKLPGQGYLSHRYAPADRSGMLSVARIPRQEQAEKDPDG